MKIKKQKKVESKEIFKTFTKEEKEKIETVKLE